MSTPVPNPGSHGSSGRFPRLRASPRAALFLALGLLAGCGGGSGSTAPATETTVDVLVRDAVSHDLSAFAAEVAALRLVRAGGGTTPNLLSGPVQLELLGLEVDPAWLVSRTVEPGLYTGAVLELTPGSYSAVSAAGVPVAVSALGHVLAVDLASALDFAPGGYRRLEIDLDLASSLSGDVGAPPIVLAPQGSVVASSSSEGIDELRGIVRGVEAGAFVIDAFVDDAMQLPLGAVRVLVGPGALLLDDNGVAFPSVAGFLSALILDATLVEVHGALQAGGSVQASIVEIEDHGGGAGDSTLVKIEGRVLALSFATPSSGTFTLSIQEIEKGAAIAGPILGNATALEVAFSATTLFFRDDDGAAGVLASAADLAVGMKVKAKFAQFSTQPFLAHKVELEDGARFEGTVTDVSGLPERFVMRLQGSSPAIASGLVQSSSTPVEVVLAGAAVFIDTDGKPPIAATRILTGMKVEVTGKLSGPPASPSIAAKSVKLRAGRLRGEVLSIAPQSASFTVLVAELKDPFGGAVGTGTVAVTLAPAVVFDDEASSAASFFALFQSLAAGESLEVEIEGLGSGFPNEVEAFEVQAKIEG